MKIQIKMKVIFVIAITALVAKPVTAQATKKAFEKRIVIPAREVRIASLLKIFSRQTGVEFSFNSNKISPSKKLLVPKQSNNLYQWLNILKETTGAEYKVVGNHVILIDNSNRGNVSQKSGELKKHVPRASTNKAGVLNATSNFNKQVVSPISNEQKQVLSANTSNATPDNNTKIIALTDSSVTNNNKSAPIAGIIKDNVEVKTLEQPIKAGLAPIPVQTSSNTPKATRQKVEREDTEDNAIQLVGGGNRHGSGDMKGMVFGAEYIKYYTKRFSLNYNFRGAINSAKDAMLFPRPDGSYDDVSIRFTTAGVQVGVNAGFSIIRTKRHDVKISVGPFGRYQSESNTDGYSLYGPTATGIQTILVGYNNKSPQVTLAFGGLLQFQYDFTFSNKLYIGITPGFQTDTNGDAIPQVGFVFGRRL